MSGGIDAFTTATRMLAALRTREISAVELLALHERRHARYHAELNAIVETCFETARQAAEAAERRSACRPGKSFARSTTRR
jgi:amidase